MMSKDFKIIISDTSCLVLLSKIKELELLRKLSTSVYITEDIQNEFGKQLPRWIKIQSPQNKNYQEILELDLDKGESSAIALSLEIQNSILLIDDLKGRKVAKKLHLNYSGTFGLIIQAKKEGVITNVKNIVEKIKKTNFRFSDELLEAILQVAKE